MTPDTETIERVAAAIESTELGFSLLLTRLVDGESTFTLTYSDGTPPITVSDIDDGYRHIRDRKHKAQAAAVIAALAVPEIDGGRFSDWSLSTIARQCRAQAQEQLDPEFSRFMAEVARRLFGFLAERNSLPAAPGIELAARFVERRRDDDVNQNGSYDPSTGMTEFPSDGEQYVYELEEIAGGIRALDTPSAPNGGE